MEPRKSTMTADGQIGEQTYEAPAVTISFTRKLSDGAYGSTEAAIYYGLEVPIGATEAEKTNAVLEGYALIKQLVNKQLDKPTAAPLAAQTPNETRIAEGFGGEIVSINDRKKTAGPRKKIADKRHLWEDVAANPSDWWDNRANKRNPLGPDFKHKTSGEGLWLSDKPEDIVL